MSGDALDGKKLYCLQPFICNQNSKIYLCFWPNKTVYQRRESCGIDHCLPPGGLSATDLLWRGHARGELHVGNDTHSS